MTSPGTAPASRCLPVQDAADSPVPLPLKPEQQQRLPAVQLQEEPSTWRHHPRASPHSTQSPPAPSSRAAAAPRNPSTAHLKPCGRGEAMWTPMSPSSTSLLSWACTGAQHPLLTGGGLWHRQGPCGCSQCLLHPVCPTLVPSCSAPVQSVHGPAPLKVFSSQQPQHGDGQQRPAVAPELIPGLGRSWPSSIVGPALPQPRTMASQQVKVVDCSVLRLQPQMQGQQVLLPRLP